MSLQTDVEQFARGLEDRAPTAVKNALELSGHNEWGVAFEILLENLFEDEILLKSTELEAAEDLSARLGLGRMHVDCLRGLAVGPDGRREAVVFTLAYTKTAAALHEFFERAFGFPYYGRNWDAFWDAITGLVTMPRTVSIYGWDVFEARMPVEAKHLLRALLEAKAEMAGDAADVELRTASEEGLDVSMVAKRLGIESTIGQGVDDTFS